ncbi:MAG: trans-aconitate 2-methyltransferase [Mycobacteriaceae bacterium]
MWDAAQYLRFADHRERPFHELLERVGAEYPRRVVDVGCGPGTLTSVLALRWPSAVVEAFDSSPEMVSAARERGVKASLGDVTEWRPGADVDVIMCNAVLQWVPDHVEVMTRWAETMAAGAWLAVQVPGNFGAPSHALTRELAAEPQWRAQLDGVLRGPETVHEPLVYAERLAALGCTVDVWESTYIQRLPGRDPVLHWISGSALRPVRATLNDADWTRFAAELAPRLREAHPETTLEGEAEGGAWMPFRRIFIVAQAI